MWEVGTRELPYKGASPEIVKLLVKEGEREELGGCFPQGYSELLTRCWHQNPNQRPQIGEIIVELEKMRVCFSVRNCHIKFAYANNLQLLYNRNQLCSKTHAILLW
jgi:hypothetical protein